MSNNGLNGAMEIEILNINELSPYENNSRTHSDTQIDLIISSIKEFGFTNPVLIDKDNGIIAGHGRVTAAKKLGLEQVPCIRLSDLTEEKKRAYVIADNQIALLSEWDEKLLSIELSYLSDMDFKLELLGFSSDEISLMMSQKITPGLTDEDERPEIPEHPVNKLGDIWLCGNHRVMCGDSTSIDAVEKLMDGKKADLGFCDPPYNLGYEYNSYDDNKSDKEYYEFSHAWFSNLIINTDRQIVTLGTNNITIMSNLGKVSGVACWVKKNWITSCHIAKLQQWEPIFFYGDYTKLKRTSDLFEINRVIQKDVGDSHTCPKQIILIEDIFSHYSINSVLDLFGGSGTSIIACEKTNRINFSMELDEKYCDVIVKRWQDYTGKQATLESTGELFNDLAGQ